MTKCKYTRSTVNACIITQVSLTLTSLWAHQVTTETAALVRTGCVCAVGVETAWARSIPFTLINICEKVLKSTLGMIETDVETDKKQS